MKRGFLTSFPLKLIITVLAASHVFSQSAIAADHPLDNLVSEIVRHDSCSDLKPFAERGNSLAQYWIGVLFIKGGIDCGGGNAEQAAIWFRKAADQGDVSAQCSLGKLYTRPLTRDDKEAVKWLQLAATQGHPQAQETLASLYSLGWGVEKDEVEAVKLLRAAAQSGLAEAQETLSRHYYTGRGIQRDYVEGARWLRQAAEQDNQIAQFALGSRYEKGQGVPRDYVQAFFWYARVPLTYYSNREMNEDAQVARAQLAKHMTLASIAEARRLVESWKPSPRSIPVEGDVCIRLGSK